MKENEIRPKKLFEEFLSYLDEDVENFFSINKDDYKKVDCPACNSKKIVEKFIKNGFTYNLCAECKTLYVSPLPPLENFNSFYTKGKSVKFWATDFYKLTENTRIEKIHKPKLKIMENIFKDELQENIDLLVDIGSGYGTFSELVKNSNYFKEVIAIEPSPVFSEYLKKKKIPVINKFMENVTKDDFKKNQYKKKLFCAFELWEHLYKPDKFLKTIKKVMNKGDYLLITTLNIMGFDLLMLWEKSKSISPPQHINFFNLYSLKLLLEKNEFKIIKAFTPGKLDVDIVRNMNISFDDHLCEYLINYSDEKLRRNLQDFIEKNNLSSHMWVIAKL